MGDTISMVKNILEESLDKVENSSYKVYFALKLGLQYINRVRYIRRLNRVRNISNDISSLKNRKSDKLFILGSGSSINNINEKGWKEIRENDSAALNFWCMHDFVPDIYFFEVPRNEERANVLYRLMKEKENEYGEVSMILKDVIPSIKRGVIEGLPDYLKENLYTPKYKLSVPGSNVKNFRAGLEYINKIFDLKESVEKNILVQKRASISALVMFGLSMGYREIILCGVDLNDAKYFWEEDSFENSIDKTKPPKSEAHSGMHKTIDTRYGEMTIDKVIRVLDSTILDREGVELYVSSDKSALFPTISLYKFTEIN